ncbi:hypothetical protein O6H91_02G043400 [Diphasiastrum complanatum]|nr:hypothetical protein O6H91_02G043400 [Diphasiastrum complanatum]
MGRKEIALTTLAIHSEMSPVLELKASDAAIGNFSNHLPSRDKIQFVDAAIDTARYKKKLLSVSSVAHSTIEEVHSSTLLILDDGCNRVSNQHNNQNAAAHEETSNSSCKKRKFYVGSNGDKKYEMDHKGAEKQRRPEMVTELWMRLEEKKAEKPQHLDEKAAKRPEKEAATSENRREERVRKKKYRDELKAAEKQRRLEEKEAAKQQRLNERAAKMPEKEAATTEKEDNERDLPKKYRDELKAADKQRRLEEKEAAKQQRLDERATKRLEKEEEKKRQQEETRKRKEEEKRLREEAKAEVAARRKAGHEKEKWDKGKFALQNTCAWIDCKVVESGLIGGHLLNRLAEKEYKFHVVSNPVEKTIMWKMKRPSAESPEMSSQNQPQDLESCGRGQMKIKKNDFESCTNLSQVVLEEIELPYVVVILEAEEFSLMVSQETLDTHIRQVQSHFPEFTICFLVNKLKWFLQKKDQSQYKLGESGWVRPNVEQALAQFMTDYTGVHSRLCLDEAEVADHVVGLTKSLAECRFKQRLTTLSVSKNGDHVVNNDPNKEAVKNDIWLKALVALPKVSGACAMAIAKKYPNMRSLLNAYLDPSLTVHQKEFLLQDLLKEGLLTAPSNVGRRIGPACSRRVFRILMAQNGNLKTDDVEDGADLFED